MSTQMSQPSQDHFDFIVEYLIELGMFSDDAYARAKEVLANAKDYEDFLKYFGLTREGALLEHS